MKMERDSIFYKIRRKLQVFAHMYLSDEFMSRVYFRIVLRKKLNLKNPCTFNEKIQWMKLYYYPKNDKIVKCTDKYTVRDFIKEKGYDYLLTPLIGVWDEVKEIEWSDLPESFVLKCNHGCAYNIVCTEKKLFDVKQAQKKLNGWMKEDFGAFNIEIHYSMINTKKIICEKYLGENLLDYKFFCFNGKAKYLYVSKNLINDRQAQMGFFYTDGKKMALTRDDYQDIDNILLPNFYDKMLSVANDLSKEFPFVRVDFFVTENRFYFSELTFTPGAGMMPFNPEQFDYEWGKEIDISNLY